MKPFVRCIPLAWFVFALASAALAVDKVTFTPDGATSPVTLVGEILDYNGTNLRLKTRNGESQSIPSSAVIGIKTRYSPAHLKGIELCQTGQVDAAIETLKLAKIEEPRKWVDREIQAWLIRCYDRKSDLASALVHFQLLSAEDPNTRHWNVAPLVWAPTATSEAIRAQARQWLIGKSEVSQLLGASLLLLEPTYGDAAERVLNQLSRNANLNISALAKCQLWRRQLSNRSVDAFTLSRWSDDIDRLPEHLKGGPKFLLASGYVVIQQYRIAAAEFLWIPLVHADHASLAARAMFEAAESLTRAGLTTEANSLYQELTASYAWSSEAKLARSRTSQTR